MSGMMNCSGWLMAAGGIVAYGALMLVAASCVKYLFFDKLRTAEAAEQEASRR